MSMPPVGSSFTFSGVEAAAAVETASAADETAVFTGSVADGSAADATDSAAGAADETAAGAADEAAVDEDAVDEAAVDEAAADETALDAVEVALCVPQPASTEAASAVHVNTLNKPFFLIYLLLSDPADFSCPYSFSFCLTVSSSSGQARRAGRRRKG
jgi:hypothetical protein